ncbi:hypothetical protein ABZ038_12545 [Streptomyces sp. NPDC006349]|uniref:hypothetical protein n=1 Tax=Streptomyces sp. NPDC006349 TaxID=3156757 RepID=UPI0006B89B04|nr:hypothetical protein ADL35_33035 [Streptomyces sp. NRRL WC-3753]
MTELSSSYVPANVTSTVNTASDIKEDQDGLISWASAASLIAAVLVVGLVVLLTIELAWREKRQRRRGGTDEAAP